MFETQDMLPRPPPRPCAPILTADTAVIKPAVPEVSIIMGPVIKPQATKQEAPQSYAAWKQQVLPRSNYAPKLPDVNANEPAPQPNSGFMTTRSNLYPMRTTVTAIPTPRTTETNVYRRSLELATAQPQQMTMHTTQVPEHRRSVDSLPQRVQAANHALTICASTQTDFHAFASNSDNVSQLMGMIKELQEEQRQMRHLLETFIIQQQQQQQQQQPPVQTVTKVYCCEVATQCDDFQFQNSEANDTLHQALPNVKIYGGNLKHTPQPVKPMAQSTTYRPNTPNNMKQVAGYSTPPSNQYQNPQLPKPNTEKSMVMNELALKYLPSEKINELLKDLALNSNPTTAATTNATPLREIDNFNKASVDISNASYKYLRKYRLLPDQNGTPPATPPQSSSQQHPTHSPYQQQQATHSPYQQQQQQQRAHGSPLAGGNGGNSETEMGTPHLDLEHIRRQPKFL